MSMSRANKNTGFKVIQPGIFSLIEDAGRFGHHAIGLTSGGPLDSDAFRWANRLCGDQQNAAAIEITVGGLVLESKVNTTIAVTGANTPLTINAQSRELWQSHQVKIGDRIELGFATSGSRSYLAVAGGFNIDAIFNSVATVPREALGGLHRDGTPLQTGDFIPCTESLSQSQLRVPESHAQITAPTALSCAWYWVTSSRPLAILINSCFSALNIELPRAATVWVLGLRAQPLNRQ